MSRPHPLALAYDWLYDRWSEPQRAVLRDKVLEACNHLIEVIRVERHSPYNVILYNAPFQALVACSIALYRDDERGEPVMRFTYDLWKNRVLPVWRQVMGAQRRLARRRRVRRHRHRAGDLPRPGDVALRDRRGHVRDRAGHSRLPRFPRSTGRCPTARTSAGATRRLLRPHRPRRGRARDRVSAIAPAYSLRPPPREPAPTSWPWGPLTDPSLVDPDAFKLAAARAPCSTASG